MRDIREDEVVCTLDVEQDDARVDGNAMASGDLDLDKWIARVYKFASKCIADDYGYTV